MKVIDLLNKIANGEEVPERLKIDNWEYDKEYEILEYELLQRLSDEDFGFNDEVEIIEEPQEHKIPEKLEICYSPDIEEEIFYEKGNKPNHYVLGDAGNKLIISKINEILDYLENNV